MKEEKVATFANRLRYALAYRDMRQADLALKAGIDKSYISNYLSGKYEPKHEKHAAIAAALDVSEIWLAGYDVPMKKEEENKNDDLVKIVARLRKDNDFLAACISLYDMNADQLNSVQGLIAAFKK